MFSPIHTFHGHTPAYDPQDTIACLHALGTLSEIGQDPDGVPLLQASIDYTPFTPLNSPAKKLKGILRLNRGQKEPAIIGGFGYFFIVCSFYDLDMADVGNFNDNPTIIVTGKPSGIDHETDTIIKFRVSSYITGITEPPFDQAYNSKHTMDRRARPQKVLTLPQWVGKYFALLDDPEESNLPSPALQAARFALSGFDPEDCSITVIDTDSHKVRQEGPMPYIRRDYDSLIGFTNDYPVHRDVAFYPLPSPERRLKNLSTGQTSMQDIDPGKIPNIIFATFGERGSVRIHFPALYEVESAGQGVLRNYREQFYDEVIRPAAQAVIPEAILDWPTSYESAEFKDRKATQGFKNSTVLINGTNAGLLAQQMRLVVQQNQDTLSWANRFVWGIEVRGIKDTTFHELDDPDLILDEAMETALAGLTTKPGDSWYMDVGLEYVVDGTALLWSTDQHIDILVSSLGIPIEDANRIVCRRGTSYTKDPATHLTTLSGFRTTTGDFGGHMSATYLQAYTTDKAQTYQPNGLTYGKAITPKQAMDGTPPPFCVALQNTYHQAKSNVNVATRLEVRVPLSSAQEALRSPPDSLWQGMVSYSRELWWVYRQLKLIAATNILTELNMNSRPQRMRECNLTFVLGLVHMINSLHSSPDETSRARRLAKAIFPLTLDGTTPGLMPSSDSLGQNTSPYDGIPYAPGGVIYLRPFFLRPEAGEIRFMVQTTLDERAYVAYWGCSPKDIRETLWPTGRTRRHLGKQITSRKGKTRRPPPPTEAGPSLPLPQFQRFDNIIVTNDPTIEETLLDIVDDPCAGPATLADRLTQIFKQFTTDIIQKIPGTNRRTNPGALTLQYCPLDQEARTLVTLDDYHNNNDFTKLFVCVQFKHANRTEWALTVNCMFPTSSDNIPADIRHFPTCDYWSVWLALLDELNVDDLTYARSVLTRMVTDMPWLPGL
ncbi:hypothetical protein CVT24_000953 [Panaeolus cyanescens]|uniref:Uncharacterized protein n=1 Tax=Panaeolus cyanescens TaxID=181874 RepID=A0A409YCK1_9AGAR|nr:hypothetical protein CVT24_000953 [Panaeolus cyanescens]